MADKRGVSPIIGVIMMVAITVMLASVIFVATGGIASRTQETNEQPLPVGDDQLVGGDMENPGTVLWNNGWSNDLQDDAEISTDNPHWGAYALKMSGDSDFTAQEVTDTVEVGSAYQLCAWSMVTDPDADAWVGIQFYDADGNIIPSLKKTHQVTWASYEKHCVVTEPVPESGWVSADVWVYRTPSTPGTVYVDDVSLVEVRYFTALEERPAS